MKKLLFYILLIGSPCLSFCQSQDTVAIKRSFDTLYSDYAVYHVVYIDNDSLSKQLKLITNFAFKSLDSTTYFQNLSHYKKRNLQKHNLNKSFPKKWIALYKYKNDYFTYSPSCFGHHYKFQITDTTTMDYTHEGAEASILISAKQYTSTKARLKRNNYWNGKYLTINIIDTTRGVAIFTFSPTKYNNTIRKVLMVDSDKAYLFKTIVNYSPDGEVDEFDFDNINFEELEESGRH